MGLSPRSGPFSDRSLVRLLSGLLAVALVAGGCSGAESDQAGTEPVFDDLLLDEDSSDETPDQLAFAAGGAVLRVSVPNLVYTLPFEVEETNPVQVLLADLLTDGLTRQNPVDGSIEPGIAESWTTSADGLVWTFTLGSATFGDGSLVTADDVVSSFGRLADRGTASVSGPNLWAVDGWVAAGSGQDAPEVAGIEAVGDDQVRFTLTTPFASLAEVLSGVVFGVVPAGVDSLFVADGELPVSSAVEFAPESVWVDGFAVSARSGDGEPVQRVEVFLDPDLTMLRAGETDMAVGFADPVDGSDVAVFPSTASSYFALNASVAPFDDPLIRQAILHAVDGAELRDEFFPSGDVMTTFSREVGAGGVDDACGSACEFDPDQARTLVQASPSRDVVVNIDFLDPFAGDDAAQGDEPIGFDEELAIAVGDMLTSVGLNVELVGRSPEVMADLVADGSLGMFRFGSVSSTIASEASIGLQFHSAGSDNVTATSIERVDDLIFEARGTIDDDERADLYSDAERVLFAEAAVLPLVEFNHTVVLGDTLVAAGLEPDGSLNLAEFEFASAE